VLYTRDSGNF